MSTVTGQSRTYDVQLAVLGARLDVAPDKSESGVAVVYHTLAPHALGAPLHRHSREDEISRVVRGELTVMQDGEITTAAPGETVVKPRDVRHTFRNAGDEPVGFVEVIAPGESAACFGEAADTVPAGELPDQAALDRLTELGAEYGSGVADGEHLRAAARTRPRHPSVRPPLHSDRSVILSRASR
jgi:mannose-6-phosphate isomerase-like protein (cupin superfamily)